MKECVVLYSGGTDSTCAAALCAQKFARVHLLTFQEHSTRFSPLPRENVSRLKQKFGREKFVAKVICTDALVKKISYTDFFRFLRKDGFLNLSTPGYSSLSWHLRTIAYCLDNEIKYVHDGMTKELMHLPGHMPAVRKKFTELYNSFGINFDGPVIEWEVPPNQSFLDRLVVNRHGFTEQTQGPGHSRTTGRWLYEQGIFPAPNVKGSQFDHRMQHDCYPFIVYNIYLFWWALRFMSWEDFVQKQVSHITEKIKLCEEWLQQREKNPELFSKAVSFGS